MQINSTRMQTIETILSTNEKIEMDLIYAPCVMRWFYNIRYNGTSKNGCKMNRGVNLLDCTGAKGVLVCIGNFDFPYLINDFSSGNFSIVEAV